MHLSPNELSSLKAAHPIDALIGQRVKLGRANAGGYRAGMCLCEPARGKLPLWVNVNAGTWGCLKGGGCGGDLFDYLQQFEGLDFASAVRRLGSQAVAPRNAIETRRDERELRRRERAEAEAERNKAWMIWQSAAPAAGSLVDAYFHHRGLDPLPSRSIRFSADEPYYDPSSDPDGAPAIVWRGPCMVAAIVRADRVFCGVHRTWLDPRLGDGPLPSGASGKATIIRADGTPLPAKKMRGAKRGGAIRLNEPRYDAARIVLIIGEGIETTATALQACQRLGAPADAYVGWAAGDLGNMSGRALGPSTPHPAHPFRWIPSDEPDPAAPGLMPPEWAHLIVLLGDGDSDPLVTEARLECARRRFEAAGRRTVIAMARAGADFNDMVRGLAA